MWACTTAFHIWDRRWDGTTWSEPYSSWRSARERSIICAKIYFKNWLNRRPSSLCHQNGTFTASCLWISLSSFPSEVVYHANLVNARMTSHIAVILRLSQSNSCFHHTLLEHYLWSKQRCFAGEINMKDTQCSNSKNKLYLMSHRNDYHILN